MAPSTATVATGMPLGIWTMESRESLPDRALDCTGTPSTGTVVLAASFSAVAASGLVAGSASTSGMGGRIPSRRILATHTGCRDQAGKRVRQRAVLT